MKTSLRKLVAMICVLAIAAVLPVMASAEGTTLTLTAPETAKAGDTIAVTLSVAGNEGWDLLDATFTADEGLTAVPSVNEWDEEVDCINGAALASAMPSVNLEEGLIGVISANVVKRNGDLLTIAFEVADDAADGEYTISMTINAFSESIIENQQNVGSTPRVEAGTVLTAKVTVGEVAPTTTTTEAVATTTTTKADETTTTTAAADSDNVPTGETATMIVLALVLLAGSAVALISMKKKALSK